MKKLLLLCFALFTITACGGGDDEELLPSTTGEDGERFFTLTNADSRFDFTYMGGLVVHPNETTQPITLHGDVADYDIIWYVGEGDNLGKERVKRSVHIDMTGKPYDITENYSVKYE